MTYEEYIQNPMGEKNAVISNRTMYRNYYQEKLDKILVREQGKTDYKTFKDGKRYLIYIKIPSEVVPNFYYDVIVEFRPPKGEITGFNLDKYDVRFYSNDPAFVFTFAHAFKKNGMFIPDFEEKMSKKALKERADEKNPKDLVGYVKSLYFTYLIMKRRGLFSKVNYVNNYHHKALLREIMDADKKIQLRQEEGEKLAQERKRERQKQKEMASKRNNQNPETPIKGFTGKIKKVSAVKTAKRTRMGNMSDKVKKVTRK